MPKVNSETAAKIAECSARSCAYNHTGVCRAGDITIDGPVPQCGTYTHAGEKAGFPTDNAVVSVCKASTCLFNNSMVCEAEEIQVMFNSEHAVCAAYQG